MQEFKQLIIICLLIVSQTVISQESEDIKQEEQSVLLGIAPTLELKESLYGVNGRLYYGVDEAFCFGPEISYFPYQNISDDIEKSIVDLNINAHYIFELNEKTGLYSLSGINYTMEEERIINHENEKEEEFGFNYGIGIHYRINNLYVFGEFKGVIGQLNAEFISAGVIFNFSLKN